MLYLPYRGLTRSLFVSPCYFLLPCVLHSAAHIGQCFYAQESYFPWLLLKLWHFSRYVPIWIPRLLSINAFHHRHKMIVDSSDPGCLNVSNFLHSPLLLCFIIFIISFLQWCSSFLTKHTNITHLLHRLNPMCALVVLTRTASFFSPTVSFLEIGSWSLNIPSIKQLSITFEQSTFVRCYFLMTKTYVCGKLITP